MKLGEELSLCGIRGIGKEWLVVLACTQCLAVLLGKKQVLDWHLTGVYAPNGRVEREETWGS